LRVDTHFNNTLLIAKHRHVLLHGFFGKITEVFDNWSVVLSVVDEHLSECVFVRLIHALNHLNGRPSDLLEAWILGVVLEIVDKAFHSFSVD